MAVNPTKIDVERLEAVDGVHKPGQELLFDPAAEKRLVRKCDLHVLPCISVLYFMAFLDRTNIGNAKIQGLTDDLHMAKDGHDYNIALFVFFIPYILFEVPSNILIKRIAPSTYLSVIMTLWGIVTIGQGLVNTTGGLVAMRFLLGLFEAGVFPGCAYLISMYYKRYELQWRLSIFFCSSVLAGGFSGLFAYAISNMGGVGGYGAWRWIFIIEGLMTVVIGIASKFFTADWPETAKFLNDTEREMLVMRLASDTGDANMNHLNKRSWRRILMDWKIYAGITMYFGVVNTGYSGSFFIPTIIQQMGFTAAGAQVRAIPIYVVATIICLVTAIATDRLQHRFSFCIAGLAIASVGYILLFCQESLAVGVRYFALYLVVGGGYMTQPVTLVWLANNVSGHYKRSVSSAMQVGLGNMAGIVASNIFFQNDSPLYRVGYGVSLGLLWLCGLACVVMFVGVKRENKKRGRGEREARLMDPDIDNMGDDHPRWRFTT